MQVCTSLQTDNHTSTPPLKFFTGQMPFLPPNQQHQSTEGRQVKALKPTLQIGTKFNRSSTRVKEMDTVHPIYLILIICAPQ